MRTATFRCLIEEILAPVDILINGTRPWDIRIHDERFFHRICNDGSLGLGESYMDGWWSCENLDEFFHRLIPSAPEKRIRRNLKLLFPMLQATFVNLATKSRACQVADVHYNKGNDLYRAMLDKRMIYSCAYWNGATNLDEAQEWIGKHIFPNSLLPSIKQIGTAVENLFIVEDWHNFGHYYDPALLPWFGNFENKWEMLKEKYDERFYRMWKYYLLSCAGLFRSREAQVWQIVLSSKGRPGGYEPVR